MKKLVIVLLVLVVGFCISSYAMVPPYVSRVEIEGESEITLYVGDEITIKAVATPEGVDSAYFLWTNDNEQVIELTGDDGTTERIPPESAATIKALSVGTVTVTVYAELWPEPAPYEYTPNDSVTVHVVEKPFVPESINIAKNCYSYNASGERVRPVKLRIPQFTVLEENSGNLLTGQTGDDIAVYENILSVLGENEHFICLNLKTDDTENPYPTIAEKTATLTTENAVGGGYSPLLGKDYRLYYAADETSELTDVSEKMTSSNKAEVKFTLQQLGFYVVCFDPAVYSTAFYLEEPQYDEEGNRLEEEPYWKNENLNAIDIIQFPPIPEKEGYVFTGWKVWGGSFQGVFYAEAQPHYVANYRKYYAAWCPEDEYEPIKIKISSEQTIKKGKEDGKKITLTTNYGVFASEEEETSAWGDITEKAIEEENKEEMIAEWKKLWNVVGSDEIMIQSATRVDDKTVELVLMGNSKNKDTDAELKVEFASYLLLPEPYEENGEIIDWHDTKIQMDEDGVRRAMYESTSITVKPYEIKESFSTAAYGLDGKRQLSLRKCAANVIPLSEDIENEIEHPQFSIIANDLLSGDEREIEIDDQVLAHAGESDRVIFFDIRGNDSENPYPDIKKLTIKVFMPPKGGGITPKIGKDYRLFYVGEELVDMTDCITEAEETEFTIQTDRLGKYVVYANSACYEVTFRYDLPICDENDELLNPDTYIVYHRIENLKANDVVDFPPIPEREGYVFTGWKEWRGSGIHYIQPQPIHASHNTEYYATWCKEEEYEPLKIEISSKKPIRKGKEDGAKIILTISDGYFHADDATFIDWQAMYDAAEDEAEKEEILYNWKGIYHNTWQIVGLDGVEIHAMKYIDSKTMEITLAGNSTDKYKNAEFYVGFLYPTISWELHDENHSVIEVADEKIKIDENGERSLFYYADNTIKVFAQRKSGGGGGSISYTVSFNTDGGSAVEKQKVEKNASAKMPEAPKKEGYTFIGWYKDEAHTEGYDFEAKVTENIILYAAWEEKTIVLTIGETKAMVFGREVQIDAAPMIQNDRTMLPIRFIAESLGAEVLWEEETKTVTVKNTDKVIKIVIGEAKALVGEEEKELDSAAFIENNRTYLPLRFIAENLGAKVTYEEETRTVTVAVQ